MAELYRSPEHQRAIRRWCTERLDAWEAQHDRTRVDTVLGETHLTWVGDGVDTCVYLPGTNFNAATSTAILQRLARWCRVVCADLPGQPGLSAAARPPDASSEAGWVAEVIARCGDGQRGGKVVLVGHSRGAALALSARPDDIDSLLLLSPAGLARVRLTPAVLARSTTWLLWPTESRSTRLVDLMAGGSPVADAPLLAEWMTLVARNTRTSGAPGPLPVHLLRRWRGHEVRILAGAGDVFFPPHRLAGPVKNALGGRVEVVPDAGHLLVDQRPDAVAAALTDALA